MEPRGYLYRGRGAGPAKGRRNLKLEHVATAAFCDIGRCSDLAVWRIGYGIQTVDLCSKHTLSTMRNRRIWLARA